ncbi:class I SAM-dependent methyltransferase [Sabulicella rubraurantiaca]|nr:50S ribosomal protein L11 methyltransferase [Sabulicella rubraurantiaca]
MVNAGGFIAAHTTIARAPLVPEIALHLATEITPIWRATEDFLRENGIEPPFWAFAWPGGQALARSVLDGPDLQGMRVLDFAAGCGIAGIAAALRGAEVECAEIDALALEACRLNATLNGVALGTPEGDVVGSPRRWDIILAGDVCYEAPMSAHILPWLRAMAGAGAEVRLADPGRAYLPRERLEALSTHRVPTSLELEDRTERVVTIARLLP